MLNLRTYQQQAIDNVSNYLRVRTDELRLRISQMVDSLKDGSLTAEQFLALAQIARDEQDIAERHILFIVAERVSDELFNNTKRIFA